MTFTLELPEAVEKHLRTAAPNLAVLAKEAMLVEFFRQGLLTRPQLAEAMGLNRMGVDAVLKRHRVVEEYLSPGELEEDLRDAEQVIKK